MYSKEIVSLIILGFLALLILGLFYFTSTTSLQKEKVKMRSKRSIQSGGYPSTAECLYYWTNRKNKRKLVTMQDLIVQNTSSTANETNRASNATESPSNLTTSTTSGPLDAISTSINFPIPDTACLSECISWQILSETLRKEFKLDHIDAPMTIIFKKIEGIRFSDWRLILNELATFAESHDESMAKVELLNGEEKCPFKYLVQITETIHIGWFSVMIRISENNASNFTLQMSNLHLQSYTMEFETISFNSEFLRRRAKRSLNMLMKRHSTIVSLFLGKNTLYSHMTEFELFWDLIEKYNLTVPLKERAIQTVSFFYQFDEKAEVVLKNLNIREYSLQQIMLNSKEVVHSLQLINNESIMIIILEKAIVVFTNGHLNNENFNSSAISIAETFINENSDICNALRVRNKAEYGKVWKRLFKKDLLQEAFGSIMKKERINK